MGFWKNFWEMLDTDIDETENKYANAEPAMAAELQASDERIGKIENRVLARPDTFRGAMKAQADARRKAIAEIEKKDNHKVLDKGREE